MINILSKETIDKIAAGEVAERPESVVKELLDNAVDSGATAISIEVRGGGLELIRLTDNGCGIEHDDIPVAFIRHATSKLKTAEDIAHVCTMGFRGEALASIAAVSNVELISKTAKDLTGTLYRIEGGVETAYREVGAPDGTTIVVRDFLANIPVRRQFLKSPQVESSYIITTVENIALAHPDISISLLVDGKSVLHSSGNGSLRDVIYIIYGRDIANGLMPMDYADRGVHISGFIGKPIVNRSKRDLEIFFVNGRCIKSDILRKAVEDAYAPFMMQHRFPMVVLNIELKPEAVDVNVHPRKTEVRFSDNALLYDVLSDAVSDGLRTKEHVIDGGAAFLKRESAGKQAYTAAPEKERALFAEAKVRYEVPQPAASGKPERAIPENPQSFHAEPYEVNRTFDYVASIEELIAKNEEKGTAEAKQEPVGHTAFLNKANVPYFRMIGQVFRTYWIIEFNDEMYLIDQHAAHEKVNYERFTARIRSNTVSSQMLFPPIVLTLSAKEAVLLEKNLDAFLELGYEIEFAGDRDYIVRAVPSNLPQIGEEELLRDLIEHVFEEGRTLSSELLKDKIASMSCKAAVKGNNELSEMEMKALIGELLTLENPYACPHGRPTIVKWSRADLDKLFKRIV